jgi:hypothetical protein
MAEVKLVPMTKWCAAVGVLSGRLAASKELSPAELKELRAHLRGPFARGLPHEAAVKVVNWMGWRVPKS